MREKEREGERERKSIIQNEFRRGTTEVSEGLQKWGASA